MPRNLGVVVFGTNRAPITQARVYVSTPARGSAGGPDNPANWLATNPDGYLLDTGIPDGYPDWLWVEAEGYYRLEQGFATQPGAIPLPPGNIDVVVGPSGTARSDQVQLPALTPVPPPPIPVPPEPIIPPVEGGPAMCSFTFFDAFHQHLDGTLSESALTQVSQLGFTWVRVFMNWGNIGFTSEPYGERFWSEIPVFWQRLRSFGLGGEMVCIAGKPYATCVANTALQQQFVARCRSARAGMTNGLEELGNELYLPENHFDWSAFSEPTDWPASSGAEINWGVSGGGPLLWRKVTYHGERWGHHQVNDCNAYEAVLFTGKDCWNDEPGKPSDYGYDPGIAWQMGRASSICRRGTFHSAWGEGQNCQVLHGAALSCAAAFARGFWGDAR